MVFGHLAALAHTDLILSFIGFIIRELTAKSPLVDLHVFKNRNFAVSCFLFGMFGVLPLRAADDPAVVCPDPAGVHRL